MWHAPRAAPELRTMTLADYLRDHELSPTAFHTALQANGLNVTYGAVRRWVRHERVPEIDAIAVIERITKGKVTTADWLRVRQSLRRERRNLLTA